VRSCFWLFMRSCFWLFTRSQEDNARTVLRVSVTPAQVCFWGYELGFVSPERAESLTRAEEKIGFFGFALDRPKNHGSDYASQKTAIQMAKHEGPKRQSETGIG
jgi:hypothetical protein